MLVSEILRIKGNVLYTTPPNAAVLSAVKVMAQHDIGSLVVMDRGRMAGIVTLSLSSDTNPPAVMMAGSHSRWSSSAGWPL